MYWVDPFSASYGYLANSPLVGQITFKQGASARMTTSKTYDNLNRLTQISSAPGGSGVPPVAFNYNYNSANQRTKDKLADGSYWVYQYDSLGQVVSGCKYFYDNTPVPGQQFDYSFDTIGNRMQTKAGGDQTGGNQRLATYLVNNLNQITSRDYPGTNDIIGAALATNSVTVNGQTAFHKGEYFWGTVNANNTASPVWLTATAASGGSSTTGNVFMPQTPEQFSYDADGNLTNDGRWSYTWDAENRLVAMTNNTGVGPLYGLTFAYDAKGRRIQKSITTDGVSFTTQSFLYDGWNLVGTLNSSFSLLNSFMWGSDLSGSPQGAGGVGGLLEVSEVSNSQITNCFAAYDGNGNLAALINAADGTSVANYEYGPFGEVIRATGPMAKANSFRFSTKYQDDESDLLMYPVRPYRPSTGCWLSRDGIEEDGGPNLYGFSGNDPIQYFDPFGYEWKVLRAKADRALATCDCNDTVAQLATKIHLDPADYTKWLKATGNSQVPASADTPLAGGSTFTIPNKVYVNDLLTWRFVWWKQWLRVERRDLGHEGYEVIPVTGTLSAQMLGQLGDADVQGIVVLAHGDPDAKGDFSDAGPGYVTPDQAAGALHHKLAGFKAIWCWSGVKEAGWRGLLSPTGYLWTYPGYIFLWDSWPGVIQHGLPDN